MAIDTVKKPRGRPRVDTEAVTVRMTRDLIARLEVWAERQPGKPITRPEAVRLLVEIGLDSEDQTIQP